MAIYDSALYQGKVWYAYDLKDYEGYYDEELRLFMKKESQSLCFTCPDCHEKMMLCAGNIMEPYFRHYSDVECTRKSIKGKGKTLEARRMLYHVLRKSFPNSEITTNSKLIFEGNKSIDLSADFLVELGEQQLVASYLSYEMKLDDWEKQHLIYQSAGVEDIWFLNASHFYTVEPNAFEYMISKYYDKMFYIDYHFVEIQVRENRRISNYTQEREVYKYPLDEFFLKKSGFQDTTYEWHD